MPLAPNGQQFRSARHWLNRLPVRACVGTLAIDVQFKRHLDVSKPRRSPAAARLATTGAL